MTPLIKNAVFKISEQDKIKVKGALGLLFGTWITVCGIFVTVALSNTEVSRVYHLMFDYFFDNGSFPDSRSFIFVAGHCSFGVYIFVLYLYVLRFIDVIWNDFLVANHDEWILFAVLFFQFAGSCLLVFFPTNWWINVVVSYIVVLSIIFMRRKELKRLYQTRGFVVDARNNVMDVAGRKSLVESTRYKMINNMFNNILVKGAAFGGPFIGAIWLSQALRAHFEVPLQYLAAGVYCTASLLLSGLFVPSLVLRMVSGLERYKESAILENDSYFEGLWR